MGRKLVMVPPHWNHPKEADQFVSMESDATYEQALENYQKELEQYNIDLEEYQVKYNEYVLYGHLLDKDKFIYLPEPWEPYFNPDPSFYRPWKDEEATWYQVWETVSEGTPVTPPFATKEELIEYLVENGDFWDQERRKRNPLDPCNLPWSRKAAENFVNDGWAPSAVLTQEGLKKGVEGIV